MSLPLLTYNTACSHSDACTAQADLDTLDAGLGFHDGLLHEVLIPSMGGLHIVLLIVAEKNPFLTVGED